MLLIELYPPPGASHPMLRGEQSAQDSPKNSKCTSPIYYTIIVGKVLLNQVQWGEMVDFERETLKLRWYGSVVAKALEPLRLFCVVNMKYFRNNKNSFSIYAKCGHKSCREFKLVISKESDNGFHEMIVYSCSCNTNHGDVRLTRFCNGAERDKVKKSLRTQKPMQYMLQSVQEVDSEFVMNGNLQCVKSALTVRKMRQEVMEENDLDKNPIAAVIKMRKHDLSTKGQSSILKIGDPMEMVICCEKRKDLLKLAREECRNDLVLHIDATGNVIRPDGSSNDKIYFYALTCRVREHILPVGEFVSTKHSTRDVTSLLFDVVQFLRKNYRKDLAKHIVCDQSFAIVNSIVFVMNEEMTLQNYLEYCYQIVTSRANSRKNGNSSFIFVHLCIAHLIKNLVRLAKTMYEKPLTKPVKEVRRKVVEIFCLLMKTHSYEDVTTVLECLFTLLLSPFKSPLVTSSLERIEQHATAVNGIPDDCNLDKLLESDIVEKDVDINNMFIVEEDITEETTQSSTCGNNVSKKGPLYKQTSFYKDFVEKEKKIVNDVSNIHNTALHSQANEFYNKKLAQFIMKHYIHILPLWTGLTSSPGVTYSNAVAENFFKQVKSNILGSELGFKLNRFLNIINSHVEGFHKKITLNIGNKRLATAYSSSVVKSRPKKRKVDQQIVSSKRTSSEINDLTTAEEAYDSQTVETWSRKKSAPFPGYLAAVKLRKTFSQTAFQECVEIDDAEIDDDLLSENALKSRNTFSQTAVQECVEIDDDLLSGNASLQIVDSQMEETCDPGSAVFEEMDSLSPGPEFQTVESSAPRDLGISDELDFSKICAMLEKNGFSIEKPFPNLNGPSLKCSLEDSHVVLDGFKNELDHLGNVLSTLKISDEELKNLIYILCSILIIMECKKFSSSLSILIDECFNSLLKDRETAESKDFLGILFMMFEDAESQFIFLHRWKSSFKKLHQSLSYLYLCGILFDCPQKQEERDIFFSYLSLKIL